MFGSGLVLSFATATSSPSELEEWLRSSQALLDHLVSLLTESTEECQESLDEEREEETSDGPALESEKSIDDVSENMGDVTREGQASTMESSSGLSYLMSATRLGDVTREGTSSTMESNSFI